MPLTSKSPDVVQILGDIGLSDLPLHWTIVRIEELLAQDRGISVGVMYPGEHDPAGTPLVKAGDLSGNRVASLPPFRISAKKHREYKRTELSGAELILSLVGDVGRCAVATPEMAGWNVARALAVVRLIEPSDSQFVRLCLLSPPLQHLMRAWSTTTVQATLNLKEIRQLPLPWPPPEERQWIVQIVDAIERRIELNRKMNETLEAMARALFKSWFVDFDPIRAKTEGCDTGLPAHIAGLFPDAFVESQLGHAPRGWDITTWGTVVTLEYGKSLSGYQTETGMYPVYGTNGKIGTCSKPLCPYPGVIIGRKGAYRGVH